MNRNSDFKFAIYNLLQFTTNESMLFLHWERTNTKTFIVDIVFNDASILFTSICNNMIAVTLSTILLLQCPTFAMRKHVHRVNSQRRLLFNKEELKDKFSKLQELQMNKWHTRSWPILKD